MKGTFAIVLMISSPFLVGGLFLLGLKALEWYRQWKYEQAVLVRNEKIARFGLKPFPGTKLRVDSDADYSSERSTYRFERGTHR